MDYDDYEPMRCPVCNEVPKVERPHPFRWIISCGVHHSSSGRTYLEAVEWWNDDEDRDVAKDVWSIQIPVNPEPLPCPICGNPPVVQIPQRSYDGRWNLTCDFHHYGDGDTYDEAVNDWNDIKERERSIEMRGQEMDFELSPCPVCCSEPILRKAGSIWICSCEGHYSVKDRILSRVEHLWNGEYYRQRPMFIRDMWKMEGLTEERMRDMLTLIRERVDIEDIIPPVEEW